MIEKFGMVAAFIAIWFLFGGYIIGFLIMGIFSLLFLIGKILEDLK